MRHFLCKIKSIVAAICVLALIGGMYYVSTWEVFDARKYVQAVLDETFKGDVAQAAVLIKDQTAEELQKHYEDGIENFLDKNVLSGVEADEEIRKKYKDLCKDIFKTMKYQVEQVKVVERREMEVTVSYQQADVFPQFVKALEEEADTFLEEAAKVKYKNTKKKQIEKQIEESFLNHSYELLEKAYKNVTYDKPEIMNFKVSGDKNNVFSIEETQISEFVVKILMIDEIKGETSEKASQ